MVKASKSSGSRSGNVAMVAAIAAPMLLGLTGVAADFAYGVTVRGNLQNAADGAAIAAAEELAIRTTSADTIDEVVTAFVNANLPGLTPHAQSSILDDRSGVQVRVEAHVPSLFGGLFGDGADASAISVARLNSGTPLCALGLNRTENATISLERNARVTANDCAVVSNSNAPNGIKSKDSAVLRAAAICSAGGKEGAYDNFEPAPLTDCPVIEDPLADRPEPPIGACTANGLQLGAGATSLAPGVYCGGLLLKAGAIVTMAPGVYVIKNGPLVVRDDAALTGMYVTLQLKGDKSSVTFDADSSIDLTASRTGALAGFVMFGDRASRGRRFTINSNDARNLLGTIYLPSDELVVGANAPVADKSAYTVVVANRMTFSAGPEFVLNADYEGTDVPVPQGVGPQDRVPYLSQ